MSRKRRQALFLVILVLWVQLVFGTGLVVWRFWLIGTGNSEIFAGVGPAVRTDDLIESVRSNCSEGLRIFYVGHLESDGFYVKYQLFPRSVTVMRVNLLLVPMDDEITTKIEEELAEGKGSCLVLDGLELNIPVTNERFNVNEQQSLFVFRGTR